MDRFFDFVDRHFGKIAIAVLAINLLFWSAVITVVLLVLAHFGIL